MEIQLILRCMREISHQRVLFFLIGIYAGGFQTESAWAHMTSKCSSEFVYVDRVTKIPSRDLPPEQKVWNFYDCLQADCDLESAPRFGKRAYDGRELVSYRKFLEGTLRNGSVQLFAFLLTGGFSLVAVPRMTNKALLLSDSLAETGTADLGCPLDLKHRLSLLDEDLNEIDAAGDAYQLRADTGLEEGEATFRTRF